MGTGLSIPESEEADEEGVGGLDCDPEIESHRSWNECPPMETMSPWDKVADSTRFSLTEIPLVLPKSRIKTV